MQIVSPMYDPNAKRSLYQRFWDWVIPETPSERDYNLAQAELFREHARALKRALDQEEAEKAKAKAEAKANQEIRKRYKLIGYVAYTTATVGDKSVNIFCNIEENLDGDRQVSYKVYTKDGKLVPNVGVQEFMHGQNEYRSWLRPWLDGHLTIEKLKKLSRQHDNLHYVLPD